jgi:hypothetical protein
MSDTFSTISSVVGVVEIFPSANTAVIVHGVLIASNAGLFSDPEAVLVLLPIYQ